MLQAIILSRQNLNLLQETGKGALKGGYVLKDSVQKPDIILMATGSEVQLIYDAYEKLKELGINARVVSIPSFEIFDAQSEEYKQSVLPNDVRVRLAVEAASDFGWYKYVGLDGKVICMNNFGTSAPGDLLFKKFGFTVENVVQNAIALIRK